MTTEEAIGILNEMLSKTAYGGSSELGGLAVKKAVEALRRQEEPVSEEKLSNVERTVKDWKEPISEDLEEAAKWMKLHVINHDVIDVFEMEKEF